MPTTSASLVCLLAGLASSMHYLGGVVCLEEADVGGHIRTDEDIRGHKRAYEEL